MRGSTSVPEPSRLVKARARRAKVLPGTGDPRARLPPHQSWERRRSGGAGTCGTGPGGRRLEAAERAAAEQARHLPLVMTPTDHVEAPAEDLATATRAALAALPGRSPRLETCPFLRAGEAADSAPVDRPAQGQRCAALDVPLDLGLRQQELVCLGAVHLHCPRYVRGEEVARRSLAPKAYGRGRPAPAVIMALGLLAGAIVVAATASGLTRPGGSAAADPTPSATAPAATGAATLIPSPSPTPGPTLIPTASRSPSVVLPAAWQGLPACPAPADCYLYRVQKNDTLHGIAAKFGTTLAVLLDLNPAISDPSTIHIGDELRVPTPA